MGGNLSVHVRRKHGQKDFTTGMRDKLKKKELLTKKILETSKIAVENPDNLTEMMGKIETSAYLEEMEKLAPGKVPSIEELKEMEQNNEIIRRQSKRQRKPNRKYKHVVVKDDIEEKGSLDDYYPDGNEQIVTLTNERGEVIKAVINIGSTVEIQAFEPEPIVQTYESQAFVEDGVVELGEVTENVIIEEEVMDVKQEGEVVTETVVSDDNIVHVGHQIVVDRRIVPTPVTIQKMKKLENTDDVIIYQHVP